jgi:hypothetical protein
MDMCKPKDHVTLIGARFIPILLERSPGVVNSTVYSDFIECMVLRQDQKGGQLIYHLVRYFRCVSLPVLLKTLPLGLSYNDTGTWTKLLDHA